MDKTQENEVEVSFDAWVSRPKALQLAQSLRSKGRGPARKVLGALKRGLYREALWGRVEDLFRCVSHAFRYVFCAFPVDFGLQLAGVAAMFLGLLQVLDSMDGEMSFPGRVAGVDRAAPKL